MAAGRCWKVVCLALFLIFFGLPSLIGCNDEIDQQFFQPGIQGMLKVAAAKPRRYLLYDVNPGEGFNLRRDVYMRIANLVKKLQDHGSWVLVLPPWGRLYHWKSSMEKQQTKIPWSAFFDLESLNRHIPVIEFEDYIKETGVAEMDEMWYLQSYKDGFFQTGKWEEKVDERDCNDPPVYHPDQSGHYRGWFWGYDEAYVLKFKCVSAQANAGLMVKPLTENTTARSIVINRAEVLIHDAYGQTDYWAARRSMRFSKELRFVGNEFRRKYLNSTDKDDKTIMWEDWRTFKPAVGSAKGGPYLAVHLRRGDFARSHTKNVPSLQGAAKQINLIMQEQKLEKVYLATDANDQEVKEIQKTVKGLVRFKPTKEQLNKYKDGGIAIIDQWICAHARYFIGTALSTFSFRIHEERTILGFEPKTTYNRLCADNQSEKECEQPSPWPVVY
ncbi:PREDICTED: GDP-fucose protein O-fucosyltransferase 2-like [Branchiostoma belcheri]|uniref:GDP-fucose protein O-fucosyltransferase 2 n=1 Tax=Branchiostoma belcheri TaxID=7741 RepID=A0A6P4ZGE4_BRABE|nr:PREDICTED: GDP-fucose protein O-fucosyltransferase 2-like [Branchiostoma belcheri]